MGQRGNIKNLWKSFRIFLFNKKKKKEEELEIIRRKKIVKKIKNNLKLGLMISISQTFRLILYLLPKKETPKKEKIDMKIENIKFLNKFEDIKYNIKKATKEKELEKCRDDLSKLHTKINKDKKFKNVIEDEILHVDKLIDEKTNIKKDESLDLGRLLIPIVAVCEDITKKTKKNDYKDKELEAKEKKEEKKEEKNIDIVINKDKINKTKSDLLDSINFIDEQLENQKNLLQIKNNNPFFFIKKTLISSFIVQSLFKNSAITLFANALVINNNIRSMRKNINKDVNYLNINELKEFRLKKEYLNKYIDKVFSNSIFQIQLFKKELIDKYGIEIEYNNELRNTLIELEKLENNIKSEKKIIKEKNNSSVMIKRK